MKTIYSRRIAAWAVFIIGFFLMFAGVLLLLRFVAGFSRVPVFIPFMFLLIGLVFAILAIKLNSRPSYIFAASFVLMIGLFILFSALEIIPRTILFRAWPLISVFSGLALIPAGWRRYSSFRARYIVPSCVFILLGITLLFFSFNIVTFSFRQFIVSWWPLLIIIVGLFMAVFSLGSRSNLGEKGK